MASTIKKNKEKIWESVLLNLELSISKANFNTWFKETDLKKIDSGVATIVVPNQFVKNWIVEKFSKIILKSLIEIEESIRTIDFIIEKKTTIPALEKKNGRKKNEENEKNTLLPLKENKTDKKDNLNPKYTFNTFIIGSFNELAFQASQVIIKKSANLYNPFLVYGNTGYGKTHLIQALGNEIKEKDPEKKIYYMTSEQFYMDVVDFIGLRSNKTNNFKQKYRNYDVLIMDDIQFLSKKEKTQEELFHLFNHLHNEGKQIILSSDKHPNQILDIEDRLRSRFSAGMIIDIQGPDYESRFEILKSKAKERNFIVQDDILEYISSAVSGNIRELEGILNNIIIQSEIKKQPLSLNSVKNIVKNNFKKRQLLSSDELVDIVSNYYNIESSNVFKKIRKKEFVKPRQIIMYLLREDFAGSYPSIGEKLGGRDHTTVMHSHEKIKNELKKDSSLQRDIELIRSMY